MAPDASDADRRAEDRRAEDRADDDRTRGDHDLLVKFGADLAHLNDVVATLVTRLEFAPVKLIAYGIVGLMLSGIIASILALVVNTKLK